MEKIFLWSVISYGITTIIVYGKIFNKPRNYIKKISSVKYMLNFLNLFPKFWLFIYTLITCVLCTSTWVGFFLNLTFYSPTKELFGDNILNLFFDGMFSAGIVWCINSIIEFFEENRIKIDGTK